MPLKEYIVVKAPSGWKEIWPRAVWIDYLAQANKVGSGKVYEAVTQFNDDDRLTDEPAKQQYELNHIKTAQSD